MGYLKFTEEDSLNQKRPETNYRERGVFSLRYTQLGGEIYILILDEEDLNYFRNKAKVMLEKERQEELNMINEKYDNAQK